MSGRKAISREQAKKLLGVGAKAGPAEIRTAYHAALKSAHPDHGGTEERLRLVLDAFRALEEAGDEAAPSSDAIPGEERLEITPVIAVVGGRVTTRLADGRRVTVSLQPGLRQGDRVKLKDTVLSVTIKGRREMFVAGDDLCMLVRTTPAVLLEGGKVTLKMPTGPKTIWVSKPEDGASIVRINGHGLPAKGKHKQGALVLKLVAERGPKDSRLRARLKKFATDWAPA